MPSSCPTPDILFFFSDQHHGLYSGYAGHPLVQTPNLDRIAAAGTACETVYTACPLCVPARGAMLTGQLPSRTGVFGNSDMVPSDQGTFLHGIAAQGYETVFCGRMHFKGADQRHGFTKRIAPDITHMHVGGLEGGETFGASFGMGGCADLAGAGTSPVLEYDRTVIAAALDYLQQDHDKPQCIVVGTYGPHFPYIAPPELFEMYRGHTDTPASWNPEGHDPNPIVDGKRQRTRKSPLADEPTPVTEEILHAIRAAYFGMITEQDRHVGAVRDAWRTHLDRSGRPGLFVYSSDHGDTCGEHGVFGKQTFYEGSVRIPLLFEGTGVQEGKRIATPVSILDIGPTLCDFAQTVPPPSQDGTSLAESLRNSEAQPSARPVISEWVQNHQQQAVAARMIRQGKWKLMHYAHPEITDQLFDIESDPDELHDCAPEQPDIHQTLLRQLQSDWNPDQTAVWFEEKRKHQGYITRWSRQVQPEEPESEVWKIPELSKQQPELLL